VSSSDADRFLAGALEAARDIVRERAPEIPRYDVQGKLGEGATAVVWRAVDRELGRPVALKALKESGAEVRARFRREAQAAASLSHPNIVGVHDVGEVDGRLYIVMELVEGPPLSDPRVLEKAARGVAAAHAKGIVHRDLKPSNILDGKVADFGLARWHEADASLTGTGTMLGTPLYMSPEQAQGRAVSPRTDVYALGAILYEMLAGRPPHTAGSLPALFGMIVHDDPPAPPGDPGLAAVCLKALEKDRERRYAHAGEFADDLARALAGEPVVARPPGALRRIGRWVRRHPTPVATTAVAAVALIALLATRRPPDTLAHQLLAQKAEQVRAVAEQWQRQGADPGPLVAILGRVQAHVVAGELASASAELDRATLLIGFDARIRQLKQIPDEWAQNAAASAAQMLRAGQLDEARTTLEEATRRGGLDVPIQERLQRKVQRVHEGVQRRSRAGGDPTPIIQLMNGLQPLLQQSRLQEAEALVDRALGMLGQTPGP